jgi:hypothetical protein
VGLWADREQRLLPARGTAVGATDADNRRGRISLMPGVDQRVPRSAVATTGISSSIARALRRRANSATSRSRGSAKDRATTAFRGSTTRPSRCSLTDVIRADDSVSSSGAGPASMNSRSSAIRSSSSPYESSHRSTFDPSVYRRAGSAPRPTVSAAPPRPSTLVLESCGPQHVERQGGSTGAGPRGDHGQGAGDHAAQRRIEIVEPELPLRSNRSSSWRTVGEPTSVRCASCNRPMGSS